MKPMFRFGRVENFKWTAQTSIDGGVTWVEGVPSMFGQEWKDWLSKCRKCDGHGIKVYYGEPNNPVIDRTKDCPTCQGSGYNPKGTANV